jgi:DNA-binding LacI/PurR family transcriptional regulator
MPPRPARPRLDDVAARAGVSTASASLVLRGKPGPSQQTREAVLAAAEALGYRADRTASLLARRRTQLFGVVMDVSSPFHAELVEEIHEAAESRGYDVVVSPLTRSRGEARAVETLLDSRCEALLLLGPSLPPADLAELAAGGVVVSIGRRLSVPGVDVVRAADDRGVALAVEHLLAAGHRDVVFADGPRGPIATLRRQGYRQAVRRALGGEAVRVVAGGSTEDDGFATVAALQADRDHRQPTAVVAFNDRLALGILDRLRRGGHAVPGEVSVVGYDDGPVARLGTVALTTVSQDPRAMAEAAVAAAADRLDGRTEHVDVVLEPHLVVRATTGPPPVAP